GDNGDDVLTGGSGSDVFHFEKGFGHDIITDFDEDLDTLTYEGYTQAEWEGASITKDANGYKVINLFDGATITLQGINYQNILQPLIDSSIANSGNGVIELDASGLGNSSPIIWNFSDQVLSVPGIYGVGISELAAHSAYHQGETVLLSEVVNFDHIEFVSSPGDDYLSVAGVDGGYFAYDRFHGSHFGSDEIVGEAGHLMILLGDYNNGQGIDASIVNGRVDLTTLKGDLRSEYVERLDGDQYDDTLRGDDNRNYIAGVDGDDTLYGNGGDDVLGGRYGDDFIEGGSGNDVIHGASGHDILKGGSGDDVIHGDENDATYPEYEPFIYGNDKLWGQEGDDTLHGNEGNDTLEGGEGSDILDGGSEDDWLIGDNGDDVLTGGSGSDVFHFEKGFGHDIITDFDEDLDTLTYEGYTQAEWEGASITKDANGYKVINLFDGATITLQGINYTGVSNADSGAPLDLSITLDPTARDGSILALSSGKFFATWNATGSDNYDIFGQFINSDGTLSGDKVLLNQFTSSRQWLPNLAELPNGNILVVWNSDGLFNVSFPDGGKATIVAQILDQGGQFLSSRFSTDEGGAPRQLHIEDYSGSVQDNPDVAVNSNGEAIFVWQSNSSAENLSDNDGYGISAKIYSASGLQPVNYGQYDNFTQILAPEFSVNESILGNQEFPRVIALQNDNFAVTWHDVLQSRVSMSVIDPSGSILHSWSNDKTLIDNVIGQKYPSISELSNGDIIIVWAEGAEMTADDVQADIDIFAQILTPELTPLTASFIIENGTNRQHLPDVASNKNGTFKVTWTDFDNGPKASIWARDFTNDGTALANKYFVGYGTESKISASDDDFIISWTGSDALHAQIRQSEETASADQNSPPVVTSIAMTSVDENNLYSYTFKAFDEDVDDVLTMTADTLPEWLTFDASTGLLHGTPGNYDIGDHSVVLTVEDASGEIVTESFTITVHDLPPTDPVFDIIAMKSDVGVYVLDIYANELLFSQKVEDFQFDIDFGSDADFVVTNVEFSIDPLFVGDYNDASAHEYSFAAFAMDEGMATDKPLISITGNVASGVSNLDFEIKNIEINNTLYESFDDILSLGSEMNGFISTRAGTLIEGASVELTSVADQSKLETLLSSSDGTFSTIVSEDINLDITKSFENSRQITVRDALETLRLSLGKTKTDGTLDDLDYIAADFNSDGKVSVRDALEILKYALKKGDHEAHWVFVESDMDTSTLARRSVVYDETMSVELSSLVNPIDITAILVGDINGSI
ncbi:MAG TPA: hypothetical protein DCE52_02425, partial [Rhodobacteraceae bacterium]|nr:hypothetical protein [Paracoccaceae bacterium]